MEDIKVAARRGLDLMEKITKDIAEARTIFKGVIEELEGPIGRDPQQWRSTKAKPGDGGSGCVRNSVKRGTNFRGEDEETSEMKRGRTSRSRSRGRSHVRSEESMKKMSNSSSGSGLSSRSGSCGSPHGSSIPAELEKGSHYDEKLLLQSTGGIGLDVGSRRNMETKPIKPGKQKNHTSPADDLRSSPVHSNGSSSTKGDSIEELIASYNLKDAIIKLKNVSKLMKSQNKVNINDLNESELKEFCSTWKAKKTECPKPSSLPHKIIVPEANAGAEEPKKGKENPSKMTSTEKRLLSARVREIVANFKMQRRHANWGASKTRPELSTSGRCAKSRPKALKFKSKAAHKEVDGKARASSFRGLLEMKRNQWVMMRNPRTGFDSIKEEVQRGIKKAVGDDDDLIKRKDSGNQYVRGNYYLVSKEGQPMQLMRYMGVSLGDLSPCESEEDTGAPSGFIPLDIASLSKAQFRMLQELGNNQGSQRNLPSKDCQEEVYEVSDEDVDE